MWEQTFNFFVDNRSNLHLHFRVFGCADGDDDDDEEDECLGEAALPVVFIFRDALASTQQVTPQTPLALKLGPADEKRVHPTAGHRLDAAVHVSWTFSNIFLKYCKKLELQIIPKPVPDHKKNKILQRLFEQSIAYEC